MREMFVNFPKENEVSKVLHGNKRRKLLRTIAYRNKKEMFTKQWPRENNVEIAPRKVTFLYCITQAKGKQTGLLLFDQEKTKCKHLHTTIWQTKETLVNFSIIPQGNKRLIFTKSLRKTKVKFFNITPGKHMVNVYKIL